MECFRTVILSLLGSKIPEVSLCRGGGKDSNVIPKIMSLTGGKMDICTYRWLVQELPKS